MPIEDWLGQRLARACSLRLQRFRERVEQVEHLVVLDGHKLAPDRPQVIESLPVANFWAVHSGLGASASRAILHTYSSARVTVIGMRTTSLKAVAGDLDPKLFAAVSNLVQSMMDQHEQQVIKEAAAAAVREVKPTRPAIRRLYDVRGAADQLSISEAKVWALIKDARLRTVRIDSRTLVSAAELDRFVAEEVKPG